MKTFNTKQLFLMLLVICSVLTGLTSCEKDITAPTEIVQEKVVNPHVMIMPPKVSESLEVKSIK